MSKGRRQKDSDTSGILLPETNLYKPPSSITLKERKEALDEFEGLLNLVQRKSPLEKEWQAFFDHHPYVLTETIPIKFDSLFSQVNLSSGPVDYLLHRREHLPFFSTTGLIELKRPEHSILDIYGSHLGLARSANHAVTQLKDYIKDLSHGHFVTEKTSLAVGNQKIVFIIIGMSEEIIRKCYTEHFQLKFQELLPPGFQILTYDHLFNTFKARTPRAIQFLVAREIDDKSSSIISLCEAIKEPLFHQGFEYVGMEENALIFKVFQKDIEDLKMIVTDGIVSIVKGRNYEYGGSYERRRVTSHIDIGISQFRFYWCDEQWDPDEYLNVNFGYDYTCDIDLKGEWVYDLIYDSNYKQLKISCSSQLLDKLIVLEEATGLLAKNTDKHVRSFNATEFDCAGVSIKYEPISNVAFSPILKTIFNFLK